jgi:serine/threonine-protein kinase
MAAVHFGQQLGPMGIKRVVAIKRLHPHLVCEEAFTQMFLDEARMAMRIRHPNVVPVLDVIAEQGELFIVMEYVAGLALVRVGPRMNGEPIPARIASAIVGDTLVGLHSAHAATNEAGEPLGLVHRDVSPHNVIVGGDGIARVIDFGIAKASGRGYATPTPGIKGKIAYMAPEQLSCAAVSARSDIYSASVMLWECLTGRKLVAGDERIAVDQILRGEFDAPSVWRPELGPQVDAAVMKGLARDPDARWASAAEMAEALDGVLPRASVLQVAAWMEERAGDALAEQAARIRAVESSAVSPAPSAERVAPAALVVPELPSTDVPLELHDTLSSAPPTSAPPPASTPVGRGTAASEIVVSARPLRWVPWVAAAAGASLALSVVYALPARRPTRIEVVGGSSAWRPPEETPTARVTLAEAVSASLQPPLAPSPSAAERPPAGPSAAVSSAHAPAVVSKTSAPAPDASRRHDDACRVPFVIDDQGRRRYNRACLNP